MPAKIKPTKEQIAFIKENIDKMKIIDIGKEIFISETTCRKWANENGIYKSKCIKTKGSTPPRVLTEEEIELIKAKWVMKPRPLREICKTLGKSATFVYRKAVELGLREPTEGDYKKGIVKRDNSNFFSWDDLKASYIY